MPPLHRPPRWVFRGLRTGARRATSQPCPRGTPPARTGRLSARRVHRRFVLAGSLQSVSIRREDPSSDELVIGADLVAVRDWFLKIRPGPPGLCVVLTRVVRGFPRTPRVSTGKSALALEVDELL